MTTEAGPTRAAVGLATYFLTGDPTMGAPRVTRSGDYDADAESVLAQRRQERLAEALETQELHWDILIPKGEFTEQQISEATQVARSSGESELRQIMAKAEATRVRRTL